MSLPFSDRRDVFGGIDRVSVLLMGMGGWIRLNIVGGGVRRLPLLLGENRGARIPPRGVALCS